MSKFADWTLAEQKVLWRRIASAALPGWNLQPQAIDWLGYSSNAVFKVRAASGAYALRLSPARPAAAAKIRSELHWLRAIRQKTPLLAPYPLATGAGQLWQTQAPPALAPQLVYCALFEFIDGAPKAARDLTAADVSAVGRYLGRLHSAAQFQPAGDFERPRLDWAGLFGAESPYHSEAESQALDDKGRAIFRSVAEAAGAVMNQLDQAAGNFGLIHADLLAKNIIFRSDSVGALDFEYSGWGYFLYDLAPLLWQLKGERAADYDALEAALWAGYTAVRPRAAAQRAWLEPFIAARQLAACRWLLRQRHHPTARALAPTLLAQRPG